MKKSTDKKFLISLMSILLVATISSLLPAAYASRPANRRMRFLLRPDSKASFDGAVDIVWVGVVQSSTYGKFSVAFYRDSDDHGTHWFTDNLVAGDEYAKITEVVYSPELPKESVELSEFQTFLEKDYLKAVTKVSGSTVFTAEFWVDGGAHLRRYVESPPNDHDDFFSFSLRRPLENAQVSGLPTGTFTSGFFDYLDIEFYGMGRRTHLERLEP